MSENQFEELKTAINRRPTEWWVFAWILALTLYAGYVRSDILNAIRDKPCTVTSNTK